MHNNYDNNGNIHLDLDERVKDFMYVMYSLKVIHMDIIKCQITLFKSTTQQEFRVPPISVLNVQLRQ